MSLLLSNKRRRKVASANPDPHWNNVIYYLKGDDFTDSSPSPKSVTLAGTQVPTIETSIKKYGTGSIFFPGNGSAGPNGYLVSNDASFALGTDNFTIEAWVYLSGYLTARGVFAIGTVSSFTNNPFYISNGRLYTVGNFDTGDTVPTDQWNHIAVSRAGTGTSQTRTFLNGNIIHTLTYATNLTGTYYRPSTLNSDAFGLNGYIDHLRVTKGVARYTSNFNPETDTYMS